jgi:hypothetical protein
MAYTEKTEIVNKLREIFGSKIESIFEHKKFENNQDALVLRIRLGHTSKEESIKKVLCDAITHWDEQRFTSLRALLLNEVRLVFSEVGGPQHYNRIKGHVFDIMNKSGGEKDRIWQRANWFYERFS